MSPILKPFRVLHPPVLMMLDFLRRGSAGGAALIVAAVAAMIWANSALAPSYQALLHWTPGVPSPAGGRPMALHYWVNDGLMAVFFLLVGLELRREVTQGELASPARLAAPGLAAVGGMAVPALIYVAFNWQQPDALRGWAVPVATDIAFALAVMSALGPRVPAALKVFLTALAIIDDLGAIVVIAAFYTKGLDLVSFGGAVVVWLGLYGMSRAGVWRLWPYLLGGLVLWALVFRSGIHATIAGVALAFVLPMPAGDDTAPASRLEHALLGWNAYLVLPVFGLFNAGLSFGTLPAHAWTDTIALGTVFGLVVGKQVGVFGTLMLAGRLRLAQLPSGVSRGQLYGASVLCGIGFTMSLFISDLAFRGAPSGDEVKLAVFVASLVSAVLGLIVLALVPRGNAPNTPALSPGQPPPEPRSA